MTVTMVRMRIQSSNTGRFQVTYGEYSGVLYEDACVEHDLDPSHWGCDFVCKFSMPSEVGEPYQKLLKAMLAMNDLYLVPVLADEDLDMYYVLSHSAEDIISLRACGFIHEMLFVEAI